MDSSRPLNILTLDGGGVRGLSSLLILRCIMERLKLSSKAKVDPLPCEVFDLICGTSTGGLIALMLGRLRMTIPQAIDCYLDFSKDIFGKRKSFPFLRKLFGLAMYDASILESCIKKIVADYGERGNGGEGLLKDSLDGKNGLCRTFVVAVTQASVDAPPKCFRTYSTSTRSVEECKIWEVARATTAASTFFDPMIIGRPPMAYIDGGLSGANNPSHLARQEVQDIFPGRPIGCFLSLGTGLPKAIAVRGDLSKIAMACVALATTCERIDHEVNREFRRNIPEGQASPYFRFSVNRGLDKITLDECDKAEELTALTQGYMETDAQVERLERCVKILNRRTAEIVARLEEDQSLV